MRTSSIRFLSLVYQCPSKCQAYCRDASVHWSSDVPISFSGIQILGSPIGDDDYMQTFCLSTAHSGADLCSKLPHLNDPQSSTLILRQCHSTRLNYLGRTVPPLLLEAARTHDQLTQYTFCSIIGKTIESFDFWEQCHLPIRSGGFGFTKREDISPAAFLSSWSNSSQQLPARFPGLNDYCSSLLDLTSTNPSIGYHLADSHQPICNSLSDDSVYDLYRLRTC